MKGKKTILCCAAFVAFFIPFLVYAAAPLAPILDVIVNEQTTTMTWSKISFANGYKLHYAPMPYTGAEPIGIIDMGSQTTLSVSLPIGSAFYVAVSAYNIDGESGYSNIGSFTINPPVTGYTYTEIWNLSTDLDVPESILYDASNDIVYISNIAGSPSNADGAGFITTLGINGNLKKSNAFPNVTLNAPKGMALFGGKLYVADISDLVEIDIATGTAIRFAAPGAIFLNDVTADLNGSIYVSDTDKNNSKIYKLSNGSITAWFDDASNLYRPNGLVVTGDYLLAGSYGDGTILSINIDTLSVKIVAKTAITIDGLLPDGNGNYFISDWDGHIYWVNSTGTETLFYTGTSNVADFEYIAENGLILIPTFNGNSVSAIKVTAQH